MMTEQQKFRHLLANLKSANYTPGSLEVSKIGRTSYVNCELSPKRNIISENVTCGMDVNVYTAAAKAIVEAVERRAFYLGRKKGLKSCQTERSDGFAAFPVFDGDNKQAMKIAREKAELEAIERYVWATWWDDPEIAFYEDDLKVFLKRNREAKVMLEELRGMIKLESSQVILPYINSGKAALVIVLLKVEGAGYITGGSCERSAEIGTAVTGALYEASRHVLAYRQVQTNNMTPKTFYEKRLIFFASGDGNEIVQDRLKRCGTIGVSLPAKVIDEEVRHPLSDSVTCYRVSFHNQPAFIGGDLARLCI